MYPNPTFFSKVFFKLYSRDNSAATLTMQVDTSVRDLLVEGSRCLDCNDPDLILVELRSSGEKVVFDHDDIGVFSRLTPNGRLYLVPSYCIDDIKAPALPAFQSTFSNFHLVSSRDVAYTLSVQDWELFNCIHEHELLYAVLGRNIHSHATPNLDRFLRRFYELQFWTAGEILSQSSPSRRAALLRKFIKVTFFCYYFYFFLYVFIFFISLDFNIAERIS